MDEQTSGSTQADGAVEAAAGPIRQFLFNGMELADLDPSMTPEQIRDLWAGTYAELANASVKGPDRVAGEGGQEIKRYTFKRNIGNLGGASAPPTGPRQLT